MSEKDIADEFLEEYNHRIFLLGIFCLDFSTTEYFLHATVQMLVGLNDRMFQALFSGLRAEEAMSNIKRIMEAIDAPSADVDRYADIFKYLKSTLEARNLVLHHGITFGNIEPDAIATNR